MKVGFTGTQLGMSKRQVVDVRKALHDLKVTEFHHGDCIGADENAHIIVRSTFGDVRIVIHPPINDSKRAWMQGDHTYPPEEYLVRNKVIVFSTDVLIACPRGEEVLRSGTWSTVRFARKLGRRIIVIYP